MLEQVAATIRRHRMFEAGQHVGVAVSGGADSVCLLRVLRELSPRWNLRLAVLHLNHGLRGAESQGDAEFVRALAAGFGFPFILREADLSGSANNLEQAAREARLDFFRQTMAERNVDRIAVGHTRSDQAETVLFRFLRGAGTAGLAGIRPVTTAGIVRPLIEIERAQVKQFLEERGLLWREDSTNASSDFARNRIRNNLLPALARDWNPCISNRLAQMADWALAEESYWADEIDRLAAEHLIPQNGFVLLKIDGLQQLPLASARRLVRRALETVKDNLRAIDFSHVNAVLALAETTEGHGRLQLPRVDVMRSFNWLRFAPLAGDGVTSGSGLAARNYRLPAPIPGVVRVPAADLAVSLQILEIPATSQGCDCVYNKKMACIDWERLSGSLELRNWRPGDQYQPLGSTGAEKIKSLFQEFRIPLWERRHWPVLTAGDEIVWTRRFGPAARFAAGPWSRKLLEINEFGIDPKHHDVYMGGEGR